MAKLTIAEAVKMVDVSQTTLYRDLKDGKLSATTDKRGRKVIDTAELIRVYGDVKPLSENETGNDGNSHWENMATDGNDGNTEISPVVSILEDQISLLKEQLADSKERLANSESRESKLLEMLQSEQEKNTQLMLPPPKKKFRILELFGFQSA